MVLQTVVRQVHQVEIEIDVTTKLIETNKKDPDGSFFILNRHLRIFPDYHNIF